MSGAPYPPLRGDEPCRTGDPERFWPESGGQSRVKAVKAECQPCPVRQECLAWALTHGEPGIWGGTSSEERAAMRRKQGIRAVSAQSPGVDRGQVVRMAERNTPRQVIAEVLGVQPTWISRVVREQRQQREVAS